MVTGVSCKWLKVEMHDSPIVRHISPPVIPSAINAPPRTNTVCTSGLRAICPLLTASSRRLPVGFSVFSPDCSAIINSVQGLSHAQHVLGQMAQIVHDVL